MTMIISLLLCTPFLYSCSSVNSHGQGKPTDFPTIESLTTEFSLEKANTIPPDNIEILIEISYFGPAHYLSPCEFYVYDNPEYLEYLENPDFLEYLEYTRPMIVENPKDNELMKTSTMSTCGWEGGEALTGIIRYPDGRVEESYIQVRDYDIVGEAILNFRPLYSDPEGKYEFEISNVHTTLEASANFFYPKEPRLYKDSSQLVFLGFLPNETIQLFVYDTQDSDDQYVEYILEFVGWQYVKVDQKGELFLDAPKGGYSFFALTSTGMEVATDQVGSILKESKLDKFFDFLELLFSDS